MPTKNTSKHKEISHRLYLTEKGQIGNKTTIRTRETTKIVNLLLDYVVSNLKEAYFLSELLGSTG